jgi:hypothetical protein
MTIEAYLEAIKERLVTDPMVTRFHAGSFSCLLEVA